METDAFQARVPAHVPPEGLDIAEGLAGRIAGKQVHLVGLAPGRRTSRAAAATSGPGASDRQHLGAGLELEQLRDATGGRPHGEARARLSGGIVIRAAADIGAELPRGQDLAPDMGAARRRRRRPRARSGGPPPPRRQRPAVTVQDAFPGDRGPVAGPPTPARHITRLVGLARHAAGSPARDPRLANRTPMSDLRCDRLTGRPSGKAPGDSVTPEKEAEMRGDCGAPLTETNGCRACTMNSGLKRNILPLPTFSAS